MPPSDRPQRIGGDGERARLRRLRQDVQRIANLCKRDYRARQAMGRLQQEAPEDVATVGLAALRRIERERVEWADAVHAVLNARKAERGRNAQA